MSNANASLSGAGKSGNVGCGGLTQRALILDSYGRPFLFMLPNSKQRYKSILGSMCTVFIISVVLIYAVYKYQLLIDKEESRVQKTLEENYFDEDHTFSTTQGFNVAFSLSSYSNKELFFSDARYGQLRLLLHERDNKSGTESVRQIQTRPCKDIKDKASSFYEYNSRAEVQFSVLWENLQCFDEPITLQGNERTSRQSSLRVLFESCDNASNWLGGNCMNKEEINNWITDKHIVTLENFEGFQQTNYDAPVKKEARVNRYQLYRGQKFEHPVELQIQRLILSDSLFSVGLLNQNNIDLFTLVKKNVIPSTYTGDSINAISGSVLFKLD